MRLSPLPPSRSSAGRVLNKDLVRPQPHRRENALPLAAGRLFTAALPVASERQQHLPQQLLHLGNVAAQLLKLIAAVAAATADMPLLLSPPPPSLRLLLPLLRLPPLTTPPREASGRAPGRIQ